MKKNIFLVMVMGVSLLQSCVSYRVKVVEHKPNVKYYFPQKRVLLGEWIDVDHRKIGSYTYEWAKEIISEDKNTKVVKPTYIKYGL
jgi:hypothetical protein